MALDLDEQSRVTSLQVELGKHREKLAEQAVQPIAVPLFVRNADGSVNTRAGVQVRGPIAPLPAKGK